MLSDNIAAIRTQLKIWRENLAALEVEEAKYAGHPPVTLTTDIAEAKRKIRELEDVVDGAKAGDEPATMMASYNGLIALIERINRSHDELRRTVQDHTHQLAQIQEHLYPRPQVRVAQGASTLLIVIYLFAWLIAETRAYLLAYPLNAFLLGLAMIGMAGLIYWLPANTR